MIEGVIGPHDADVAAPLRGDHAVQDRRTCIMGSSKPDQHEGKIAKMEMHLVLGGPLASGNLAHLTAQQIEIVGLFPSYDEAIDAWRGASQRMIDDAEMRYMIVPLHRIVAPMLGIEVDAA